MDIKRSSVTFEPGARTAWDTHPLGLTLVVTTGGGGRREHDSVTSTPEAPRPTRAGPAHS